MKPSDLAIIGIILGLLILMIPLVVLIDSELRAAFMQIQMDQHEDEIETGSSRESQNALGLRQNPLPESSHSESDPSIVQDSKRSARRQWDHRRMVERRRWPFRKTSDQEGGSQADGELDLHERANHDSETGRVQGGWTQAVRRPGECTPRRVLHPSRGWVAAPG